MVSVNVNGIRDLIFNCLKGDNYDIILSLETHCGSDLQSEKWGGKSFWNNGTSLSNQIFILKFQTYFQIRKNVFYPSRLHLMMGIFIVCGQFMLIIMYQRGNLFNS